MFPMIKRLIASGVNEALPIRKEIVEGWGLNQNSALFVAIKQLRFYCLLDNTCPNNSILRLIKIGCSAVLTRWLK